MHMAKSIQLGEPRRFEARAKWQPEISVYMTRRSYTRSNPVVGLPHQTPDIHQCLDGLTSETSKNLDTSIILEKFSPRNSFFDCKSSKTRSGRWAPNVCLVLGTYRDQK